MFNFFKKESILERIENKNYIKRLLIYFLCVFLLALLYNCFFVPYNLVMGGVGGLAIVVKDLTGFSTTIFTNLATIILLIISFITIGKDTKKSVLGALTYPIMVALSEPIAKHINIEINSYLFMVIVVCLIYGLLYGIIYKIGYNTGGTDIVLEIVNKYRPMPKGAGCIYINIGIVILSGISFGITRGIYGILCLYLGNVITDFFLLGNRDSKLCLIKTREYKELEKLLANDYNIGYTVLKSSSGTDRLKRTTLFCIVPSEMYYDFRHKLKIIDDSAFLVSSNCYEVNGGYRKHSFISSL